MKRRRCVAQMAGRVWRTGHEGGQERSSGYVADSPPMQRKTRWKKTNADVAAERQTGNDDGDADSTCSTTATAASSAVRRVYLTPNTQSSLASRDVPRSGVKGDPRIRDICVIGGGPSGLGCCKALCDAGFAVTLVQESRGLGGKLCTKFVNGKDDPHLHFDMAVQLIKPAGPLREVLGDAVQPWPSAGRFKRLNCSGDWQKWRLDSVTDLQTSGFVVGVPSMSAIGRHLANQCEGLTIHIDRTAHVNNNISKNGMWEVEWKREAATGNQLKYRPELKDVPMEVGRGSFDAVVLAFEANKIVRGCKSGYKMTQPSATPYIQKQARGAKTCQLWNLMVAFDTELPMPWDAATIEGHPSIAWVAVDSSKPQRARVPQCFMLFSTRAWADWKQWARHEVEKELLVDFLHFLETILKQRPPKPSFVLGGRWGNSTDTVLSGTAPSGEFPMRALDFNEGSSKVVWDERGQMGATGDWTRGWSVSDAYASGVDTAAAIIGTK